MSRATARSVALEVLLAVRASDAYANLLLPARIVRAGLSPQDAALATELTYGTLRGRLLYDAVIARAAKRPVSRIDPDVLDLLRLGVHQLLATRIPAHAVVDESVRLATGALRKRSASGFVNGVLRAVAREDPATWRERAVEGRSGDDALAVRFAHPAWIVAALRDALAREGRTGELEALLTADNDAPRVALVALPGLAAPEGLGEPARVSPVAALAPAGDPARVPAVIEGRARVQDEGSQLAALALSRARPVRAGERWLDLCAGPGGKAAL
ncbi:MAG: rRNA small subunit methyltransferase B, partial [Actinomycetales bacterium]|nr:rRNA small subunit methyltransferase B [Actinomycetales bacterium]